MSDEQLHNAGRRRFVRNAGVTTLAAGSGLYFAPEVVSGQARGEAGQLNHDLAQVQDNPSLSQQYRSAMHRAQERAWEDDMNARAGAKALLVTGAGMTLTNLPPSSEPLPDEGKYNPQVNAERRSILKLAGVVSGATVIGSGIKAGRHYGNAEVTQGRADALRKELAMDSASGEPSPGKQEAVALLERQATLQQGIAGAVTTAGTALVALQQGVARRIINGYDKDNDNSGPKR